MKCQRAMELVSRHVDNELSFEEREALLAHLKGCATCHAHARSLEEDAFRIRRVLRFFRPKKAEFIQRTIALITEHEEPHREIAPAEEPAGARSQWRLVAALTVPAAAAVVALCIYRLVAGPAFDELDQLRDTATANRTSISSLESTVRSQAEEVNRLRAKLARANDGTERPSPLVDLPGPVASDGSRKPAAGSSGTNSAPEQTASEGSAQKLDRVQLGMQKLLEALDDDDLPKAMMIAMELGNAVIEMNSLSGQVASRLMDILNRPNVDPDNRVRLTEMLGKIHTDVAASYFRDELSKPDAQNNVSLRRALADGLAENADETPATRDLLTAMLYDPREDYDVRVAAARGLLEVAASAADGDALIVKIQALIVGEGQLTDPRLRIGVIQLLAHAPESTNLLDFLSAVVLNGHEQDERVAALDSLGDLSTDAARAALQQIENNQQVPSDLRSRARRNTERSRTQPRPSHGNDRGH
jgi:putative zinc finger protein